MRYALAWIVIVLGQPLFAAQLAVVIDDIGYSHSHGMRAIKLPGPVTLAVLPFAPNSAHLAELASRRGHDVIVHQPMQSLQSLQSGQASSAPHEHGTLTMEMPRREFDVALAQALDAIPQRIGLSNHTGSLLTSQHAPMHRLMDHLQSRQLFFLDSRTTAQTVALKVAHERGVPALRRDVFLDHDPTPAAIRASFDRALKIARKKGHAVIIGHPYAASLTLLEQRLNNLPADITLVRAVDLAQRIPISRPAVLAQPPSPVTPHISLGR